MNEQPTFARLSAILGEPDRDVGSGIFVLIYDLSDGTRLKVGTADRKSVLYVYHGSERIFQKKAEPQR
jgi:hypothetical protein